MADGSTHPHADLPWPFMQSWPFKAKIADGKTVEVLALDLVYAWVRVKEYRPYTIRLEHIVGPAE